MPYAEIHQFSEAGSTVAFATVGTTASRAYTTFAGWTTTNERSFGNELTFGASHESIICGGDGTGLYAAGWGCQIVRQTTGANMKVAVCRNGSALSNFVAIEPMQGSTAIRRNIHGYGLLRLNNANDALTVRVFEDATVAATANVFNAHLAIVRISTTSSSQSGVFV